MESRITITNGGQVIVVESGPAPPPARSARFSVGRVVLALLGVLVRLFNVLLWGTLGVLVGFFWALLRKRN